MIDKIKIWFEKTGISNVAYLAIGVFCLFIGSSLLAGASFGIFTYINFNVIYKMIRNIKL